MAEIFDREKIKSIMRAKIEAGLECVGQFLEAFVKKSFPATSGRGLHHIPSAPGQPPAVDTGRLRASITHKVEFPAVLVGTNVEYAPRLEFGFVGTDSAGRVYNQPARPFLRPAALNNKEQIEKAFLKGSRGS